MLKNNETKFYSTFTFDDLDDIKAALVELNNKLENCTRQISFWDIYNVTQVLLSDSDMNAKIALLNNGESAIVNANTIVNGNQTYWRGDILYRQLDGTLLYIPAENKGIYVPTLSYDETSHMLRLSYAYDSTPQDSEQEIIVDVDTSQQAYLLDVDVNSTNFSAVSGTGNSKYTISALYIDDNQTTILRPIIRFYIATANTYEDFYCDWHWAAEVDEHGNTNINIFVPSTVTSLGVVMRVR